MTDKPDILIYMSDQHSASMVAGKDPYVETPFLTELAQKAYVFDAAYTSCPLCVPARASFLTARLPSRLGVFSNGDDFKSSEVTFAHLCGIAGYQTSLIGRMHLVGEDQLHGFDQHVGSDITAGYWGCGAKERKDWGAYAPGFGFKGCTKVLGVGDSPVLAYDRDVMRWTEETLGNHASAGPQLFVVGTYGPHFPYVAPRDLMEKYLGKAPRVSWPQTSVHPACRQKQIHGDERINAIVAAAYRSMVEIQDMHIHHVHDLFLAFLRETGHQGIFIYTSDHGDMMGRRNLYGKQVFYESASHIPLYLEFIGHKAGKHLSTPVSLMDIGPTISELAAAPNYPETDGESLLSLLENENQDRHVVAEFFDQDAEHAWHGHLFVQGKHKQITYSRWPDADEWYNPEQDPEELHPLSPGVKIPKTYLQEAERALPDYQKTKARNKILSAYGSLRIKEKNGKTTDWLSFEEKGPASI